MKKNFKDLGDFIDTLEKCGELVRVKNQVSPEIDISKITDAESKKPNGGKALLFENVIDNGKKTFPIATNLFGSSRRTALALGVENISEIEKEIGELTRLAPPRGFAQIWSLAKKILPLTRIAPSKFRGAIAPCQQVVQTGESINLEEIPVLKCWTGDGGRFVTLPLVFTKSPDGKMQNLGMYRLQIFDKKTTGMHWHIHKDASHFYNEYSAQNKRMPVAVAIGADPATIYSATAPMPRGIFELLLAGFIRKKSVKTVKCKTIDIDVPADAEFVLEGYVDPLERRLEGPFGDHTGYYSLADMYPVFHLTAITRKEKPIYCATLVGPPPMEDCYLAKATERIFLPLLQTVMPEISDYFLPWEGVFHNIVIVAMKKEYPAHAQRLISGLWGQGQMSFCKCVVAVDHDIDPSDFKEIWRRFIESFDPSADIFIADGVLDALDHSAPAPLRGAKLGIDLTRRFEGESPREILEIVDANESEKTAIKNFLETHIGGIANVEFQKGFCAIALQKAQRRGVDILASLDSSKLFDGKFRAVAIFDAEINICDNSKILWKIFNNTDPSRDILRAKSGTCFIDACKKTPADGHMREWPDDLSFDK